MENTQDIHSYNWASDSRWLVEYIIYLVDNLVVVIDRYYSMVSIYYKITVTINIG